MRIGLNWQGLICQQKTTILLKKTTRDNLRAMEKKVNRNDSLIQELIALRKERKTR